MLISGDKLSKEVQAEALRRFVHRFTKDHTPHWAEENNETLYLVQFASDTEWLANTKFHVNKDGTLSKRHCESSPTWPKGDGGPASGERYFKKLSEHFWEFTTKEGM